MRIVGGRWGGRRIEAPAGRGTRPTTERAREAVASMILSAAELDLAGVSVLDAFAGSGAMGLELLSRGAESCVFVERDRRAAALVRKNVAALGAGDRTRVLAGDAFALAERGSLGGPFAVVYLDPPYATSAEAVSRLVASLAAHGALAPGAVVAYERAAGSPGLSVPGLSVPRTRSLGAGAVDLMTFGGSDE